MPAKTKKQYPGSGAKGTILTRFIHPRVVAAIDPTHRTAVTLIKLEVKKVNNKQQECFVFTCLDGPYYNDICYSVKKHIIVTEEGHRTGFFYHDDVDEAEKRDEEAAFVEPKIKWRKSKAKYLLNELIVNGEIPETASDNDGNSLMDLEEIYYMNEEFAKYSYEKFAGRLARVRENIKLNKSRAEEDQIAFDLYISNHDVSLFSRKGYIQWQGSVSQNLLLNDIKNGLHIVNKPKVFWESRREYYEEFPLAVFRSKIQQEIRTAKYVHTVKTKGIRYQAS